MSEYRAALQALLDVVRKEILNDSEPAYLSPAYDMAKALLARPEPEPRITREDGEKAREWQPIESAPNGVSILVAYDDGNVELKDAEDNDYQWQNCKVPIRGVILPTHWMLLPSPPAASDGEKS